MVVLLIVEAVMILVCMLDMDRRYSFCFMELSETEILLDKDPLTLFVLYLLKEKLSIHIVDAFHFLLPYLKQDLAIRT